MTYYFTKHAKEKIIKTRKAGFLVTVDTVKKTVSKPLRIEDRYDGTYIVSSLLYGNHILRVVYRVDGDIIVIITLYAGRRKAYGL
jgi:hypothetical protein